MKYCHLCDNIDGPWEYYPKQNKSSEKAKNYMISKLKLIVTDNSMVVNGGQIYDDQIYKWKII